ncbi:hypothetical protein [Helicobacter suis]|uniref:hypothetical protein n=1 Tax=Helicobacter suis TaxID=104628 RepID=UPI0013D8239B|nr:hypothetical protein [Helicobacter suis]
MAKEYIGLDEDQIAYLESDPFYTLYDEYGNLPDYDKILMDKGYERNKDSDDDPVTPVMREKKR